MGRLADQIREALTAFAALKTPPALIGGLALAAHNYVRSTQDVDFLAAAEDAEQLHELLLGLGYRCLHRSADAANYARGDERIDFLFAHRPASERLLRDAKLRQTAMGRLRVVSAEGLIGLKLQGFVNDPKRTRDMDDIRSLLRANRGRLNIDELRDYFRLFQREPLLDDLLAETRE